jgi:hypothetical protein
MSENSASAIGGWVGHETDHPLEYDQRALSYWTDIFTLETWAQAEQHGWNVSGFPPPTKGRGGYSDRMFGRVRVGDVFLCYCKNPAARWVGALRIKGDMYIDEEPVWGLTEDGTVRFPARFAVEPLVVLDPARGVPGAEAAEELACLSRFKHWGTFLQRSLNKMPDDDGERLLAMLREPRPEAPITVPQRRAQRASAAQAPERGHLEAQAQPPTLTSIDGGERIEDELREPRTHSEIQAKLRDIGIFEGFDVWVADRGTKWNDEELGAGCLADLPIVAAERTRAVMKNIDVIWFRRGTGHPVRFFEIEHSTSVYSGLLRMNDVMIDFPIPKAFIVGDGEKTQRKFEREIARRTFQHSELKNVTQFLRYDQVRQTWQKYRSVGTGSKEWGSGASQGSQQPA